MKVSAAYTRLDILANRICCAGEMPEPRVVLAAEMVEYHKTPAQVVIDLVKRVEWRAEDVFVDLGSGLGQVVLMVHLLAGVRARGVEIEPEYCEYARKCAARLGLAGVGFIEGDVREADLSEGTVFFLFTPFRGEMLRQVLERLRAEAAQRMIRVIGYGPCTKELEELEWLRREGGVGERGRVGERGYEGVVIREGDEGEEAYTLKLFTSCLV